MLRRVTAVRYVVPLREGGSLPGVVEADDGQLYVVKLRGAGQGTNALAAEVIGGELARAAHLRVPELVTVELPAGFGSTEGDPEIHDLLIASVGDNVGLAFLTGALGFDPAARDAVAPELAARVVALDILISNVDRTVRNPNILQIDGTPWLIDHGAALYWHHAWDGGLANVTAPLPRLAEHVLWPVGELPTAAAAIARDLPDAVISTAVAAARPWLAHPEDAYVARLGARRDALVALAEAARA